MLITNSSDSYTNFEFHLLWFLFQLFKLRKNRGKNSWNKLVETFDEFVVRLAKRACPCAHVYVDFQSYLKYVPEKFGVLFIFSILSKLIMKNIVDKRMKILDIWILSYLLTSVSKTRLHIWHCHWYECVTVFLKQTLLGNWIFENVDNF